MTAFTSLPAAVRAAIKQCTKCKSEKSTDEFHLQGTGLLHSWCRDCCNRARTARRDRGRLTPKKKYRPPYSIQPGQSFGRWTIVGFSHSQRSRHYYQAKCQCGTERAVAASNLLSGTTQSCGCLARELWSEQRSKPNNGSAITTIISSYMRNAADRGLTWDLTRDDVDRLVRMPCHYCADPAGNYLRARVRSGEFRFNGLDRVDNGLGYFLDNVVPCCGICNRCKHTLSKEEFVTWACKIASRRDAGAI